MAESHFDFNPFNTIRDYMVSTVPVMQTPTSQYENAGLELKCSIIYGTVLSLIEAHTLIEARPSYLSPKKKKF